jgi:hypothetical protein
MWMRVEGKPDVEEVAVRWGKFCEGFGEENWGVFGRSIFRIRTSIIAEGLQIWMNSYVFDFIVWKPVPSCRSNCGLGKLSTILDMKTP